MSPFNQLTHPEHPAVVITRRPRPGHEAAFQDWARGIFQVMAAQPGFRSYQAVPPVEATARDWFFVFTFEDEATLKTWLQSDLRAQWQARSEELTEGPGAARVVHGLEALMGLPAEHGDTPAWKLAALTELGLAPTVFAVGLLLLQLPFYAAWGKGGHWGAWWQVLLSTAICVSCMTWLVMPVLMRAFRKWLYPAN